MRPFGSMHIGGYSRLWAVTNGRPRVSPRLKPGPARTLRVRSQAFCSRTMRYIVIGRPRLLAFSNCNCIRVIIATNERKRSASRTKKAPPPVGKRTRTLLIARSKSGAPQNARRFLYRYNQRRCKLISDRVTIGVIPHKRNRLRRRFATEGRRRRSLALRHRHYLNKG